MSAPGTPGPWAARESGPHIMVEAPSGSIAVAFGVSVTATGGVTGVRTRAEAEANGHLMAAAKEMYEALEALLDHPSDYSAHCLGSCRPGINQHEAGCPYQRAVTAMAKARGE